MKKQRKLISKPFHRNGLPLSHEGVGTKQFLLKSIKPKSIAEQLTLIMYNIYLNIPFDNFDCMDNNNYYTQNYTKMFNQIVCWVQYSILIAPNSKLRAKIIKKWIIVCGFLLKLNNFHGLIAINCALKSNCVYPKKLKIAWYKHKSVIKKKHHNQLKLISDIVSYR
eukprot:UN11361